jgi:DegV family protein with EDD domain
MLGSANISIIDSLTVSVPLTFQVLSAATLAREGKSREEIVAFIESHKKNARVIFIPSTLEYLHKGGRIGGAQALIGTLLQIKPVLVVQDGTVSVLDKVRSRQKAFERLLAEVPNGIEDLHLAVVHILAPENAAVIKEMLNQKLPGQEIFIYGIGPVLATHSGPGVFGLGYWW